MTTTCVQTSVDNAPAIAAAGMLYDSSAAKDVVSIRATEDTPFGAWVSISGESAELPDATGDVTALSGGIALHSHEFATEAGYKAGDLMSVLVKGRVWVETETTVADEESVCVRFTANTGPTRPIGGILSGTDSGKAVARPGLTCYRGNTAAGLAVLQLNGNVF